MKTFDECLKKGGLKKVSADGNITERELDAAKKDFESCQRSVEEDDWNWAVVQAYYSAFHAARALLLKKGYKERSHECVPVALRQLYKKLPQDGIESLETLRYLRLKANYELEELQETTAKKAAEVAEAFLKVAEDVLKKGDE